MSEKSFKRGVLNRSLVVFFLNAVRVALQSPFLEKLHADPEFARETGGGCVLWKKREEVAAVLKETGPG
jgi:hypothetical protein